MRQLPISYHKHIQYPTKTCIINQKRLKIVYKICYLKDKGRIFDYLSAINYYLKLCTHIKPKPDKI